MTRYGKPKGQRWSDWGDSCAVALAVPLAFTVGVAVLAVYGARRAVALLRG